MTITIINDKEEEMTYEELRRESEVIVFSKVDNVHFCSRRGSWSGEVRRLLKSGAYFVTYYFGGQPLEYRDTYIMLPDHGDCGVGMNSDFDIAEIGFTRSGALAERLRGSHGRVEGLDELQHKLAEEIT
jgi:hypothetical protein